MNFLLDSMQNGSGKADGFIGNGNYWILLIVFILGALAGYGIRCIVQAIKDAPPRNDTPPKKRKGNNSKSDE